MNLFTNKGALNLSTQLMIAHIYVFISPSKQNHIHLHHSLFQALSSWGGRKKTEAEKTASLEQAIYTTKVFDI